MDLCLELGNGDIEIEEILYTFYNYNKISCFSKTLCDWKLFKFGCYFCDRYQKIYLAQPISVMDATVKCSWSC